MCIRDRVSIIYIIRTLSFNCFIRRMTIYTFYYNFFGSLCFSFKADCLFSFIIESVPRVISNVYFFFDFLLFLGYWAFLFFCLCSFRYFFFFHHRATNDLCFLRGDWRLTFYLQIVNIFFQINNVLAFANRIVLVSQPSRLFSTLHSYISTDPKGTFPYQVILF